MEKYWKDYEKQGWYLTGDSARMDKDGYFWIIGRNDDVIKVSGYRLGSAEIESALVSHPAVTEAAAIGLPDQLKGNIIHASVILPQDLQATEELADELKKHVQTEIGPLPNPNSLCSWIPCPKPGAARSCGAYSRPGPLGQDEGDISTLEE